MSPSRPIIFDLDRTLVRPPDDGPERLRRAFDRADVPPFFGVEDVNRWIPRVEGESALDLRLKVFRAIAREADESEADAERVARAYEPPAPDEHEPIPGAERVVRTFQERGTPLALVTNGAESTQREKLRLLGVEDAFDATFFATPETGIKPDPAPFTAAAADLGRVPDECVSVGDRYEIDIEPARDLGMTTVWFPDGSPDRDAPAADHVIERLTALLDTPWEG